MTSSFNNGVQHTCDRSGEAPAQAPRSDAGTASGAAVVWALANMAPTCLTHGSATPQDGDTRNGEDQNVASNRTIQACRGARAMRCMAPITHSGIHRALLGRLVQQALERDSDRDAGTIHVLTARNGRTAIVLMEARTAAG